MTRAEYDRRVEAAAKFKKLMEVPEFCLVDELMVKLNREASELSMLTVPREQITRVYDMLSGRLECVALIQNAFREWIQDLALDPKEIDPEPVSE